MPLYTVIDLPHFSAPESACIILSMAVKICFLVAHGQPNLDAWHCTKTPVTEHAAHCFAAHTAVLTVC